MRSAAKNALSATSTQRQQWRRRRQSRLVVIGAKIDAKIETTIAGTATKRENSDAITFGAITITTTAALTMGIVTTTIATMLG